MLKKPYSRERFVVLTEGRSGSRLLEKALDQHPDIVMYGEIFNPGDFHPRQLRGQCDITTPYHAGLDSAAYAQQIFASSATAKAIGFKLLYNQAPEGSVWDYLANTRTKIVRLSRNWLHVMISWTAARLTRQWHAQRGQNVIPTPPFKLQAEKLQKAFDHYKELHNEKLGLFSRNEILDITYEGLATDFLGTLHQVFDFLGVERFDPEPQLIKTGRPPLEVLQNYQELKEHFRGTEYESFFDE